ncbi:NeuD/PglB/VioB family sugar acetyltransferase [Microbacterium murale]|uniref:Acetyltransferase n=1 Tax=Microbacterium murale TaxID=1081040 RepID=A0ABQ1RRG5_9MICO|nr:NeuD/PglB/VioB family sugar acetyltransferase [Microbacterium murale]GGD75716.1 hypothetical protein GCM10007269_18510 [Microbacterium murale]
MTEAEGVLLIGASGLAREVLAAGMVGVTGILDDDTALHGTEISGVPVRGSIDSAVDRDEQLLVCIGPSTIRRQVVQRLRRLGVGADRFAIFAARTARIGSTSDIGAGSIVLDGTVITADATLGSHVVVMPNCTITHDDVIDDFATLAAGAAIGGSARIGEAAYVGMNASVKQGVAVGAGATVGMGSVVLVDVPDQEIWAGVPARQLGADS